MQDATEMKDVIRREQAADMPEAHREYSFAEGSKTQDPEEVEEAKQTKQEDDEVTRGGIYVSQQNPSLYVSQANPSHRTSNMFHLGSTVT